MMTAVTAFPEGDLWVIDCARCGLICVATSLVVDELILDHARNHTMENA